MRYTPFLDKYGITFKDEVLDHAVNIIDSCLAYLEQTVEWGEWEGRRRKPCPEQPLLLAGQPIGQYHCPGCGMMLIAGVPHLSPAAPSEQDPNYPLDDYEQEYGCPWPPGYEDG
jgi:hypothetical protein